MRVFLILHVDIILIQRRHLVQLTFLDYFSSLRDSCAQLRCENLDMMVMGQLQARTNNNIRPFLSKMDIKSALNFFMESAKTSCTTSFIALKIMVLLQETMLMHTGLHTIVCWNAIISIFFGIRMLNNTQFYFVSIFVSTYQAFAIHSFKVKQLEMLFFLLRKY